MYPILSKLFIVYFMYVNLVFIDENIHFISLSLSTLCRIKNDGTFPNYTFCWIIEMVLLKNKRYEIWDLRTINICVHSDPNWILFSLIDLMNQCTKMFFEFFGVLLKMLCFMKYTINNYFAIWLNKLFYSPAKTAFWLNKNNRHGSVKRHSLHISLKC